MRYVLGSAFVVATLGAMAVVSSQAPAFAVASVKRNTSGEQTWSMQPQPGGRLTLINVPVRLMIRAAYGLQEYELVGGPGWIDTDRFDVIARADGNPPQTQMLLMARTLLADRFSLRLREEMRELPIYALVLARPDRRLGPMLRPAQPCFRASLDAPPQSPPPGSGPACGFRGGPGSPKIEGRGVTLAALGFGLAARVGRVVVDRTQLEGNFDLDVEFAPDVTTDGTSIFTALQEQLGLRLESTRGPVKVMVIDRVAPPTED